jgi:hypothetical protein
MTPPGASEPDSHTDRHRNSVLATHGQDAIGQIAICEPRVDTGQPRQNISRRLAALGIVRPRERRADIALLAIDRRPGGADALAGYSATM